MADITDIWDLPLDHKEFYSYEPDMHLDHGSFGPDITKKRQIGLIAITYVLHGWKIGDEPITPAIDGSKLFLLNRRTYGDMCWKQTRMSWQEMLTGHEGYAGRLRRDMEQILKEGAERMTPRETLLNIKKNWMHIFGYKHTLPDYYFVPMRQLYYLCLEAENPTINWSLLEDPLMEYNALCMRVLMRRFNLQKRERTQKKIPEPDWNRKLEIPLNFRRLGNKNFCAPPADPLWGSLCPLLEKQQLEKKIKRAAEQDKQQLACQAEPTPL